MDRMLKLKIVAYLSFVIFFGIALTSVTAIAQTIAYRQTNLASSLPNVASNSSPTLANPWGIGFLTGQPFFFADNHGGHITSLDATGLGVSPGAFVLPNAAGTGFSSPTGIVADQNSSFGSASLVQPFIIVTDDGTIFTGGPDARGDLPSNATLVVNHSEQGAVYKAAAILNSSQSAPALAVADVHGGFIETFLPGLAPVALAGSFTDPTLPPGYAPFGIQVIRTQVFVAYALQDAAKHDPIPGAGNGVISIFDIDGNFVKRFATGGALNAPWGIVKASPSFGPFSNDILIGNVGNGKINAFDPSSGELVGVLVDGDGVDIAEVGLHGLAFRRDAFGDANVLYFTSQINNDNNGLFAVITTGLVSAIRVSATDVAVDTRTTLTADVSAGPGNTGSPTGTVTFLDGSASLGAASLVNGSASLDVVFPDAGAHAIAGEYSGDRTFLPRSERIPLQVTGIATTSTPVVPAQAAPGTTVTLTATVSSASGIPTGQVAFLDATTNLGSAPLDGAGVAVLRANTLTAGSHSLSVSYAGDAKFGVCTSAAVSINIASPDFSLGAAPSAANVIAGHLTKFQLTVAPSSGFASAVTFSCAPVSGVTCSFNPSTVTPAGSPANTTLTVTTSATVSRYGLLTPGQIGPWTLIVSLALLGFAIGRAQNLPSVCLSSFAASTAVILILGLVIGGCGGYSNNSQANKGTVTIMVTAQSGTVSHATTVNVTVQ
jgi:uncharacterized protein (TIGR03118 family)